MHKHHDHAQASCYENNVIPIWKRYTTNIFLRLMENLYCEMTLIIIKITMGREKCTYYREPKGNKSHAASTVALIVNHG